MTPTWEQSVRTARAGNWRAIEGRFAAAMASFEQIHPASSMARFAGGQARTLLDFATDVGMEYSTIAYYRSVVYWWYDSDLSLAEEIGLPHRFSWGALRWGKASLITAADLRADTDDVEPGNGKTFSAVDLEILFRDSARERRPTDLGPFDNTLKTVNKTVDRLTATLMTVHQLDLTTKQRDRLLEEVAKARAPLDFLASYLAGDETVMEQIDEFLARERASA